MKKLLAAAAFAAFAAPAAAQTTGTVDYDVAGLVPTVCGLNAGSAIDPTAIQGRLVSFDFTGVASATEIEAISTAGSARSPIVAYCNSPGGVTFAWTVDPLVRVNGDAANPNDVIDFRVNGQFSSPYGATPNRIATGYTTGAQRTGQNATAFVGVGPFVAPGNFTFRAFGVQAANGAYTKNAGNYLGAFTATLTAN